MPPRSPLVRFARQGALAFEFTGSIMAAVAVGWLVDRWLGSAPWGVVVLTLVGVAGAFARMIQLLRRFDRVDRDG